MLERTPVERTVVERIHRNGPITFAAFQEAALYDPDGGFFVAGGGAGRAGRDFLTSPEVGSLFGALVARYLDAAWRRLGEPDPFVVIEGGAGCGRLAVDVLRAGLDCAPALRYVLVERSPRLREEQRELLSLEPADEALGPFLASTDPDDPARPLPRTGPIVSSLGELPSVEVDGVVLANELLDNLPVRLVERTEHGWDEIRVGVDDASGAEGLAEVLVSADAELAAEADVVADGVECTVGERLPVPTAIVDWLAQVAATMRRGELVLVDYADETEGLVSRGFDRWMRTYRRHERGGDPLESPGSQDLTCDVPLGYLRSVLARVGFEVESVTTQAQWLVGLGVGELVEEGRALWEERAHLGDLQAIAGRSRVTEAAALTDPAGLGGHQVITATRRRK
ncbi:MAG: SAM-dependent methyltransferase [Acidimicrobiia bacterium]